MPALAQAGGWHHLVTRFRLLGKEQMTFRSATLATAVIMLTAGAPSAAFAQLAGAERDDFVAGSIKSCLATAAKKHPELSAERANVFCSCMANAEADMTTPADIAYVRQNSVTSPDYRQRVLALAPGCNARAGLH
jgi:hypothetical protein